MRSARYRGRCFLGAEWCWGERPIAGGGVVGARGVELGARRRFFPLAVFVDPEVVVGAQPARYPGGGVGAAFRVGASGPGSRRPCSTFRWVRLPRLPGPEGDVVLPVYGPAAVCVVPSGNLNPPEVLSMVPATLSFCAGVGVPIPTLPSGVTRIRSAQVPVADRRRRELQIRPVRRVGPVLRRLEHHLPAAGGPRRCPVARTARPPRMSLVWTAVGAAGVPRAAR